MSDKPKAPTSFTVLWEFRVKPGKQRGFEQAYGSAGEWVQLFRRSEDYLGTELMRDRDLRLRYVTLDRWRSRQAYLRFKKENLEAYREIDAKCEAFTTREKLIGEFDTPYDRIRTGPEPAAEASPGAPGLSRTQPAAGRRSPLRPPR